MGANPPLPNYPNQFPCAMWTACPGFNVFGNYYYPYVNMGDNYMDYSPSSCMNFFSKKQKERIWSVLNIYRPTLLNNQTYLCFTDLEKLYLDQASVQLSPIPTSDKINVSNLKAGTSIVITNLLGVKLIETEAQSESTKIDVSHLPNGMYFLNRIRFIKE